MYKVKEGDEMSDNSSSVEKLPYEVVTSDGSIEIRKYDDIHIVEVGTYKERLGQSGFMELYHFITGDNEEHKQIPMTAPVLNELKTDHETIAFVMPSHMKEEEIPRPSNKQVEVKTINKGLYAVIRFSGLTNQGKVDKKIQELIKWLKENHYKIRSNPFLARFDQPLTNPLKRTNEIMIKIEAM
jgi:effector-binding domain-containing protein